MEEVLRGQTFLLLECTESIKKMALGHNELEMSLLHQAKKLMGFSC